MKQRYVAGLLLSVLMIMFSGCSLNSLDDFYYEGEAFCRSFAKELSAIRTREDVVKAEYKMRKRFHELVDLIILARKFEQDLSEEERREKKREGHFSNYLLLEQLTRIYMIEGGKEMIERAQREALIRLDAFEKDLQRQKQKLPS